MVIHLQKKTNYQIAEEQCNQNRFGDIPFGKGTAPK